MVQTEQITFYTHFYSPYCHRVQIALEQAGAEYTSYSIDFFNKPDWYAAKVNPIGKIPAITYGGPKVPADAPSAESAKLAESLVILEFLADVFPSANMLPADPVERAKVRFFNTVFDSKVFGGFRDFFFMRGHPDDGTTLIDSLETMQKLLPPSGFVAGDAFTIADMAAAPFLARIYLLLGAELGKFPLGEGKKTLDILKSERFARLDKYLKNVKEYPSFKTTWDEEAQLAVWSTNPVFKRS